ncbi:zinc finger protein, putative [Ricinus communis]|uniref:Zinc finger protein, putative n=1 Tax=Ricinus communis TaxID=3988 RepID=B9RM99_RICCO|nr:zinc finger protein, putative [Ricinus communis]|eukprot:XP_002514868.1 protein MICRORCHIDIA 7 [Ricinus communis]
MDNSSVTVKQESPEPIVNSSSSSSKHSFSGTTGTGSNDFGISSDINENNKRNRNTSGSCFDSLKIPKVENFSAMPADSLGSLQDNNARTPSSTFDQEVQSPLPLTAVYNNQEIYSSRNNNKAATALRCCKQFWKAGDYEEVTAHDHTHSAVGMDHVRMHPKFLHSNATSHKWALGAFAELLDNSLDEYNNGATYVNVDILRNQKDGSVMLLVEDNGGGMDPHKMRGCMSFGYSDKSREADSIGEYGNGFKTSTMRVGADVIVFSRSKGKDNMSPTQSIGLLSYTFLRATGKEDIVVPMIDLEKRGQGWDKKIRSSLNDWNANLDIILQWSPFASEEDLNQQFNSLEDHGTRVIIYNLWEDEEGTMELDFDADPHDIQIRGVNRDEKSIQMAETYPNCKHFLTYKHSLRSYAAILYLKLPIGFKIVLRGKDVEHHDISDDMMLAEDITYRPQSGNNLNVVAKGKIGFVKDAHHHIDIQGFCIYHRNRLIKAYCRLWNAAGSDGRGVIGVLEANFVKPAHDKQGFERTDVLQRLELRLIDIQKRYWSRNCHEIGYAPRCNVRSRTSSSTKRSNTKGQCSTSAANKLPAVAISLNQPSSTTGDQRCAPTNAVNLAGQGSANTSRTPFSSAQGRRDWTASIRSQQISTDSHSTQQAYISQGHTNIDTERINTMKAKEGPESSERLNGRTANMMDVCIKSLQSERDNRRKLASQLEEKTNELEAEKEKLNELDQINYLLINALQEERNAFAQEKKVLADKLEDALKEIDELKERVRQPEDSKLKSCKTEQQ